MPAKYCLSPSGNAFLCIPIETTSLFYKSQKPLKVSPYRKDMKMPNYYLVKVHNLVHSNVYWTIILSDSVPFCKKHAYLFVINGVKLDPNTQQQANWMNDSIGLPLKDREVVAFMDYV